MKSSREQFERWFGDNFDRPYYSDDEREDLKVYTFLAWRASRAAIEIELPDKVMVEDEFDIGHNWAIDYCADAIHAAGLTVKGES